VKELNKTVLELKMEIETLKKTQRETTMEMENYERKQESEIQTAPTDCKR
jgi:molecular chaperone GrpE (heat shock protein)